MIKRQTPLTEEQQQAEIARLEAVVEEFAQVMKAKLADKVREGRSGWDNPALAEQLYTDLLAHAVCNRLTQGQEITVANLAMFLWYQRTHSTFWIRDDRATVDLLRTVDYEVPMEVIEGWTIGQVIEAEHWAGTMHLAASDKPFKVPSPPPHLEPYRRAA